MDNKVIVNDLSEVKPSPEEETKASVQSPEEDPENTKKEKKKKRSFGWGYLCGFLSMFVICGLTVLILCLTKIMFIGGKVGVADSELIAKANAIGVYISENSLYGYDEEVLKEGMLDGLLSATGDKYARYYNPEELKEVFNDYNGNFYGIGCIIKQTDEGVVYLSGIYEDSPAERAGLLAGDIIRAVDGTDCTGMDLYEVAELMRGEKGTEVVLVVYRESIDDTVECRAVRDKIKKIDVESRMLTDDIGYILLKDFDDVAIDQFAEALASLNEQGMKDMVLDLRGNTGGLIRVALDITRQIMCKGVIFSTRNAQGETSEFTCDGKNEFQGRIVILTDAYTASASEIMAGALRDNGMAVTLGTTTFGKGVVQDFFFLSDGSGIKLTIEQYFTPNGTEINGIGITPDIEVPLDYEAYIEDGTDNQLDAAIEYLEK